MPEKTVYNREETWLLYKTKINKTLLSMPSNTINGAIMAFGSEAPMLTGRDCGNGSTVRIIEQVSVT